MVNCHLHKKHSSKMVLVSYPESVIQGVIVGLEHDGICQGARKKRAAIHWPARFCCLGVSRDQVEGKIPKALALATACVRLLTPSLP
jgi:hypothetical protein